MFELDLLWTEECLVFPALVATKSTSSIRISLRFVFVIVAFRLLLTLSRLVLSGGPSLVSFDTFLFKRCFRQSLTRVCCPIRSVCTYASFAPSFPPDCMNIPFLCVLSDDPDHANAFASTAWELSLLKASYHPYLCKYTTDLLNGKARRHLSEGCDSFRSLHYLPHSIFLEREGGRERGDVMDSSCFLFVSKVWQLLFFSQCSHIAFHLLSPFPLLRFSIHRH